ncbi:uncharacterized protein LOC111271449 [Varroa jacobsoni]|uniref:uncharacterized protein LOC111271449 n=1 Tax=Varroa jacobsoni TaxID=62625 RepID=UPI000BF62B9F|nr:uncharacterized protein LOC111271449 [Varroa jacobsoni]
MATPCFDSRSFVVINVLLISLWNVAQAAPMNDFNKGHSQEGVILPDGYELTRCSRIASQNDSRLLVCLDTKEEPVLLTISSVKDFSSFTARNQSPPQSKYLIAPRTSHFVPSFLRRCLPAPPINREQRDHSIPRLAESQNNRLHRSFFNCHDSTTEYATLRVGLAHHILRDKRWIEVVVVDSNNRQISGTSGEKEGLHHKSPAVKAFNSSSHIFDTHEADNQKTITEQADDAASVGERTDCVDEHDPNCDLESARNEDN